MFNFKYVENFQQPSLVTFSQLALKLVFDYENNANGAVDDIKVDSQVNVHSFMSIVAP